jgi:UDP-N-acetyl-D-glucosamine dehydrogenase
MPKVVVRRAAELLNERKKSVKGSKVMLLGVSYKRDTSDLRESPALDVLELLHRRGAVLSYTDPYVPALQHGSLDLTSVPERDAADGIDCAVICTNHTVFDYPAMAARFPLIVDTRNALKGHNGGHIVRL